MLIHAQCMKPDDHLPLKVALGVFSPIPRLVAVLLVYLVGVPDPLDQPAYARYAVSQQSQYLRPRLVRGLLDAEPGRHGIPRVPMHEYGDDSKLPMGLAFLDLLGYHQRRHWFYAIDVANNFYIDGGIRGSSTEVSYVSALLIVKLILIKYCSLRGTILFETQYGIRLDFGVLSAWIAISLALDRNIWGMQTTP
jgi:hypothetical protein